MKRIMFLSLLVLTAFVLPLSVGMAQQPVAELESVQISIWPDFDDPSVLVLMTGQLPQGTAMPAEVSIPIPEDAEINAVAHVDESGMVSIDYEIDDGAVTFTTMNPRFRVEYYAPYEASGRSRAYDFDWQSGFSVGELTAEVQQPANAGTLSTEPNATNVYTNQTDGLVYHGFDPRAVAAGTPYQISFSYEMVSDGLTVGSAEPIESAPARNTGQAAVPSTEDGNNWFLLAGIAGLVALAVVGTWLAISRSGGKKSTRPAKPKPRARSTVSSAVVYCHNCGQPADGTDAFCRKCGTELKRP